MRIGKLRFFGCDHNVAGERQLESAGNRKAVDCADYRHFHVIDYGDEGGLTFVADTARTRAELPEVKTDTESATRTSDDDYADVLIAPQVLHRMAECQSQFAVESIELVRPVEGDGGNAVPLIYEDY